MDDHPFDNAELLTRRLSLRRPEPSDVDAVFAVHSDPRACAHNPGDAVADRAEAAALFARWSGHWKRFGFGYWVVSRRDTGALLGFCGLKFMHFDGRQVLNLFYRLDPGAWGAGVASEAASAAVRWTTTSLPGYPIIARVRPENVASQRVATKAGLVRTPHLDGPGYDGFDEIFVANWPS